MESIINLILENLFFVIIVLFGLFNLITRSNKSKKQQEGRKPEVQQRPMQNKQVSPEKSDIPPLTESKVEQLAEETRMEDVSNPIDYETKSLEKHRQEQIEYLKRQYQPNNLEEDLDWIPNVSPSYQQSTIQSNIQNNTKKESTYMNLNQRLTKNGLIESVIMAEVLGPPKARKGRYSHRINHRMK